MDDRPTRTPALWAEGGTWTLAALGLWLATLSSVSLPEVCFALACAIPCGICAVATRRALGDAWHLRRRWLALPLLVAWTALADLAGVMRAASSRSSGRLRHVDLPTEPERTAQARAALFILGISATPGGLAIHVDNGLRRFVVHDLASSGKRIEEVLTDGPVDRR
jgi:hypothetical protein